MLNEDNYVIFEKDEFFKIFTFYKYGYAKCLNDLEEFDIIKQKYAETCSLLEKMSRENTDFSHEITRLNTIIDDMERELEKSKALNENYEKKIKDIQYEQKMMDELNKSTFELGNIIMSANNVVAEAYKVQSNTQEEEDLDEKLSETIKHYERIIESQNEHFKQSLLDEEQQQICLRNELKSLRDHAAQLNKREADLVSALDKAHETIQLLSTDKEALEYDLKLGFDLKNNCK